MKNLIKLSAIGFAFFAVGLLVSCIQEDVPKRSNYEVAYLPSQCAPDHSGVLGLHAPNGKYYLVFEGYELMDGFEDGDEVEVNITVSDTGWAVCLACTCPAPDSGAKLHSIRKL